MNGYRKKTKKQLHLTIMIDRLIEYDHALMRLLNGFHTPWLDPVMFIMTETISWIPLFIVLLYLVIKTYKKESWIIFLGIALTILLADQITASVMKPYFARLRPSREPALEGMIHIVEGYTGGHFGFASSHAANTFGVATFFFLAFRNTRRYVLWLFAWAAFVSYTRIYLGVHYPGDILVGGAVGMVCGWVAFKLSEWLLLWFEKRSTPSPG